MAKSKSFFGLRRGSTKSHTYSILDGMQITKDRVENVKNPQTSAQMIQRVVFATVTKAAEKMLPIIGISQQGITNETESRRRWISQNVKKLREAAMRMNKGGAVEAAFAPKGNDQLIPNSYQMSKGSLSLAAALVPKTTAADGKSFGAAAFANVGVVANIPDGSYTGADLWRLIFGVLPGDQLTFPQIYGEGIAQSLLGGSGGVVLDCTRFTDFCAPRIVFKSAVAEPTTIVLDNEADIPASIKNVMKEWVDVENTWYDIDDILADVEFANGNTSIIVSVDRAYDDIFAINNDDPLRAIGCIRSHKNIETGKWEYSTSNLVCIWADDNRDSISNYFGFTLLNAVDTYKSNVVTDSEGNFLQRGTDSNIVPESFQ